MTTVHKALTSALLLFVGILAIGGGAMLIYDPTGETMQFSLDLLETTPFKDYLIPGIILIVMIGLFNIIVAYMTIRNHPSYSKLVILQGMMLIIWLTIELILNPNFYYSILHIPLYIIGIYFILSELILNKHK